MEPATEKSDSKWGAVGVMVAITLVSFAWFFVGQTYGYNQRESEMYARGYKDGQQSIYDIAMIRIRGQEKEIDALRGRKMP